MLTKITTKIKKNKEKETENYPSWRNPPPTTSVPLFVLRRPRRFLGNFGEPASPPRHKRVRQPRRQRKWGGNKSEYYKVYRFCGRRESRRREKMMHEIIQYKIMSHTYSCGNYMWIGWEGEAGRPGGGGGAASYGATCADRDAPDKTSLNK